MNKNTVDLEYIPARFWKRIDAFSASSDDGSVVTLDIRGLVAYRRPDSYYLSLGVELEDGGEPHDASYGPPPVDKPLVVYGEGESNLMYEGQITQYKVNKNKFNLYVESIIIALKEIGYSSKIVRQ